MKIDLSFETTSNIVIESCREYRDELKEQIALHEQDPDRFWMHEDDLIHGKQMIVHLDAVIKDFGG